jgi:hypothetical protein
VIVGKSSHLRNRAMMTSFQDFYLKRQTIPYRVFSALSLTPFRYCRLQQMNQRNERPSRRVRLLRREVLRRLLMGFKEIRGIKKNGEREYTEGKIQLWRKASNEHSISLIAGFPLSASCSGAALLAFSNAVYAAHPDRKVDRKTERQP